MATYKEKMKKISQEQKNKRYATRNKREKSIMKVERKGL